MFANQRIVRAAAPAMRAARRNMSGHSAEEAKAETLQWKKYSAMMFGATGLVTVYNIAVHDHDHPRTDLPYMRMRNKPYPWRECPDCNIFEPNCWAKCRGEEVADEHH